MSNPETCSNAQFKTNSSSQVRSQAASSLEQNLNNQPPKHINSQSYLVTSIPQIKEDVSQKVDFVTAMLNNTDLF